MSEASPTISVIVPTKNSAATLAACLESVREQSYDSVELIVVDNHSEDRTADIARGYTDRVFTEGPERCAQRNFGAAQASGEFLVFIDSDMILGREVLADCVREMKYSPETVGVIIPEESFGEGFWAACKRLERSFYVGVDWMEAARFFRRAVFEQVGGYDQSLVSGEDWDLSQRIARHGNIGRVDEFIRHNEGSPTLHGLVRKKIYYAGKMAAYARKPEHDSNVVKQMGLLARYGLFLSEPRRLFTKPAVGLGMLFMKTCEFGAGGAAYLAARAKRRAAERKNI